MTREEALSLIAGDWVRISPSPFEYGFMKIPRDIVFIVTGWTQEISSSYGERIEIRVVSRPEDAARIEQAVGRKMPRRTEHPNLNGVMLFVNYYTDIQLVGRGQDFKDPAFPHVCPSCKGPAYFGAVPAAFECKWSCGR